ncbi:MAG: TetR/AcrR family transcriptional regulator [Bacteroidota bacterium]
MTELKEKIIRQAKQMFWDYGLKRVGIDDICNELHISKKTFYTVFKTKNELIEEILKSVRIEKKQMEEIADNDNIIEYLISKTNTFRNKPRRDDEKLFQIHFDMKKYYSELFDKHCRLIKEDSEVNTLSILNMGIAQGLFREDMDLTLTKKLISEIFSNMLEYSNTNKIPFIHMMDFCMDTMFRIVCNDKGLEYYNSINNKQ